MVLTGKPSHGVGSIDSHGIRVLHVIGAVDPEFGGTAEVSVNMCIASRRAGVHTTLAFAVAAEAEDAIRPIEVRLLSEGVGVRRFRTVPVMRFYARRWGISLRLCRWILRHTGRFDVVHIHQAWGLAQIAAVLAAGAWRRPCIITPHESLTNYDVDREKRLVKALLKRWYLGAAVGIWVTSPLEAKDSVPPRHAAKARVVPYPLSPLVGPRPPSPLREPDAPLTVGFLGRLHPKKNVDLLIRALPLAPGDTRLRVAGNGPEPFEQHLLKCADDAGVAHRVEWLGFVARHDRTTFLDSLDALLLVSEYESFGLAIAEALVQGRPVIVSPNTGIASIVEKYGCGFVVDATEAAVADALQRLAADPELAVHMGQQGRLAVERELSMDVYGLATRLGYQEHVVSQR